MTCCLYGNHRNNKIIRLLCRAVEDNPEVVAERVSPMPNMMMPSIGLITHVPIHFSDLGQSC